MAISRDFMEGFRDKRAISRDFMEGFRDKRAISREISCIHNHASIGKFNCKNREQCLTGLGVTVNINCLINYA